MAARLEGAIYENSFRGVALGFQFQIKANLPKGRLTICSLFLGARSWRALSTCSFDWSPGKRSKISDYEINGVFERADGLETVRMSRLALGRPKELLLPAVVNAYIGEQPAEISLVLQIGAVTVFGDIGQDEPPGIIQAISLAERFLDLDDYRIEAGGKHVRFVPHM